MDEGTGSARGPRNRTAVLSLEDDGVSALLV